MKLAASLLLISLLLVQSVEAQPNSNPAAKAAHITTIEQANQVAAEVLAKHLADHRDEAKKPLELSKFNIALTFPRSRWPERTLRSYARQLGQGMSNAAGFLAQLASDWGAGAVNLQVILVPDGDLIRTAGAAHTSLYVPIGEMNETELRYAYDEGHFIHVENWISPLAHMEVKKRRALWRLKNKLRLVFRKAARLLVGDIDKLRGKRGEALRQAARNLIARAIGKKVKGSDGGSLRDRVLGRLAKAKDDKAVIGFLKRWRESAGDPREAEAAAEFMAGALQGGNKITDERDIWALLSVDTFDAVTVAPDDVLKRHGAPLLNEVVLKGLRVSLIHVTSVDTVAVVPDLARMLLGGTTVERAEDALTEETEQAPATSSLRQRIEPAND